MRYRWPIGLLALVVLATGARTRDDAAETGRGSSGSFAFVNVTVIPMDRAGAIKGQTVLVSNGRIQRVGPTPRLRAPGGYTVIDAGFRPRSWSRGSRRSPGDTGPAHEAG